MGATDPDKVRNNYFHVDNMKQLFQDIHIDSIMTFLRQIDLFVQLKNMYSYLNSSLKLSDIVRGLS